MVLVLSNRLCVSGPCLYMKIMPKEVGEAGGLRGALQGFPLPPNRDPRRWAAT